MFIQTENTPNPNSIKFIPGTKVSPNAAMNFATNSDSTSSPLASILLALNSVDSVFLGHDFITITKKSDAEWDKIKSEILLTIMEYISSGKPIVIENTRHIKEQTEEDSLVVQIKELIETKVRPAVAQDGGDIIFHSFENGIVKLELRGACSGCPSSTITLKNGIENMLKHYVPEVESVEAVEAAELN